MSPNDRVSTTWWRQTRPGTHQLLSERKYQEISHKKKLGNRLKAKTRKQEKVIYIALRDCCRVQPETRQRGNYREIPYIGVYKSGPFQLAVEDGVETDTWTQVKTLWSLKTLEECSSCLAHRGTTCPACSQSKASHWLKLPSSQTPGNRHCKPSAASGLELNIVVFFRNSSC